MQIVSGVSGVFGDRITSQTSHAIHNFLWQNMSKSCQLGSCVPQMKALPEQWMEVGAMKSRTRASLYARSSVVSQLLSFGSLGEYPSMPGTKQG